MKLYLIKIITIILLQMFTKIKYTNQSDLNENVFRFSQNNFNDNSNLLSMTAVLIECPDDVEDGGKPKIKADYNCEDKIIATIRMKRTGKPCDEMGKILLLDEVFDKKLKSKAKLMSPYLIQIKNGDPVVMYPLEFVDNISCPNCTANATSDTSTTSKPDTSRNKKSYLSPNGNIKDYDRFFQELDADTEKVKGNMMNYLESADFYDDLKNNDHKTRNVAPSEIDRGTKDTDCSCGCRSCDEYSGLQKCNCCGKCNKYRNPCQCRECAYVADSLKCECCASLSSCHNGMCSFNGEHFICEGGICRKSGTSQSDPDGFDVGMFNHKYKKLAKETENFNLDNKFNNFEDSDSEVLGYDSHSNNNYKNYNDDAVRYGPSNDYNVQNYHTSDYGGRKRYNNYRERNKYEVDPVDVNNYNNRINEEADYDSALANNNFNHHNYYYPADKQEDNLNSHNFNEINDLQDFDAPDGINKKRNEHNKIYYDSKDDDENDYEDDFQLNVNKFNENNDEGDNQMEEDNNDDIAPKNDIDFQKRKIMKPHRKQHHHQQPFKLKNLDIKFPYKKLNYRRNLEQKQSPLFVQLPSILSKPDMSVVSQPRAVSSQEKIPFGEFLSDDYLNDNDKIKLLDTLDLHHNIDEDLDRLLKSNNDKTIVVPSSSTTKHCYNSKSDSPIFFRWRKNINQQLPQPNFNNKLRKRSLFGYENDNIENDFDENFSAKFTKRNVYDHYNEQRLTNRRLDEDNDPGTELGGLQNGQTNFERYKHKAKVIQPRKLNQNHPQVNDNKKGDDSDDDNDDDSRDDNDELNDEALDEINETKEVSTISEKKAEKPKGGNTNNNKDNKNVQKPNTDKVKETKDNEKVNCKETKRSVKDVWFSVFNMSAPLQFLTVKVHIFRKQNNTWRKIAQPLLLTSSSRIYANNNLSIIFSFHSDYVNLENSLDHNRFKLLLPNNKINNTKKEHPKKSNVTGRSIDSSDMLTVDTTKIPIYDKRLLHANAAKLCEAQAKIEMMRHGEDYLSRIRREKEMGLHILDDLGKVENFEKYSIVDNCVNGTNKTCLKGLNKKIPAHKLAIKIPFIENSVIVPSIDFVRITNIIIDGSSLELLGITVFLTNFGLKAAEYKVILTKCIPTVINGDNIKHKKLLPHIGLKACFKLPIQAIVEYGVKEVMCEVEVASSGTRIVAKRKFPVRAQSRCFCIWNCACSCISAFALADAAEICHPLKTNDYKEAGFGGAFLQEEEEQSVFDWTAIIVLLALFFLLLLLLGLIKAILGICIHPVGRWRYDYLQPNQQYDNSSCCRRFFINSIFFLVFPCVCCCYCFEPKEEDELLINSSSTWQKTIIQNEINYAVDEDDDEPESDDELAKLLAESEKVSEPYSKKQPADSNSGTTGMTTYNDEDEEKDTSFVLSALTESRESLKLIEGHLSEDSLIKSFPQYPEAVALVKKLLEAKIVYRVFQGPVGDVIINKNQKFSIRGYFLPSLGPGYDFITPTPLKQYYTITEGKAELTPLTPPKLLNQAAFTLTYKTKIDVIEKSDLMFTPDPSTPCINVIVQDVNMYQFKE